MTNTIWNLIMVILDDTKCWMWNVQPQNLLGYILLAEHLTSELENKYYGRKKLWVEWNWYKSLWWIGTFLLISCASQYWITFRIIKKTFNITWLKISSDIRNWEINILIELVDYIIILSKLVLKLTSSMKRLLLL